MFSWSVVLQAYDAKSRLTLYVTPERWSAELCSQSNPPLFNKTAANLWRRRGVSQSSTLMDSDAAGKPDAPELFWQIPRLLRYFDERRGKNILISRTLWSKMNAILSGWGLQPSVAGSLCGLSGWHNRYITCMWCLWIELTVRTHTVCWLGHNYKSAGQLFSISVECEYGLAHSGTDQPFCFYGSIFL